MSFPPHPSKTAWSFSLAFPALQQEGVRPAGVFECPSSMWVGLKSTVVASGGADVELSHRGWVRHAQTVIKPGK